MCGGAAQAKLELVGLITESETLRLLSLLLALLALAVRPRALSEEKRPDILVDTRFGFGGGGGGMLSALLPVAAARRARAAWQRV
jgi:hypothetical protein